MTKIKRHLRGPRENLAEELFEPGFKGCSLYRRQTAFFRPSILKCWSTSLQDIVENETKLEILMGFSHENDHMMSAIKGLQSSQARANFLDKEANEIFKSCLGMAAKSPDPSNRIKIIRYLYSKELLEIKLIASFNPDTNELSLAHEKAGYFIDNTGKTILFNGSANESESAFLRHGEHLTVYSSEKENDDEDLKYFKDDLDTKWNENDKYSKVFKPTKELLRIVKEHSQLKTKQDALEIARQIIEEEEKEKEIYFPLRKHQERAIRKWENKGYRGILDHATGSGKTYTAIRSIQALQKKVDQLVVIIGVPYISLADQWEDQLNGHFSKVAKRNKFKFNGVIPCHSDTDSHFNHATKFGAESLDCKESISSQKGHLSIFLVVHDTLFSKSFSQIINDENYIKPSRLFFIGDECHNYSSFKNLSFMNQEAKFRLGLSATAFNDESEKTPEEIGMENYFGEICDRYSLADGIDDGHLCSYKYYPRECYLDEEEYLEWQSYLDNYQSKSNKSDAFKEMEKIIDKSKDKYQAFESLLEGTDLSSKKGTIIFCGQNRVDEIRCIDYVGKELDKRNWTYHRITYKESKSERKNAINGFEKGDINSLTAVRVLDEGIDIPEIKTAILLASSARRRQFIQRRGRVLRNDGDKKKVAIIYDFIVLPSPDFSEKGKILLEREISRVKAMGEDAINSSEVDDFVKNLKGLYGTV